MMNKEEICDYPSVPVNLFFLIRYIKSASCGSHKIGSSERIRYFTSCAKRFSFTGLGKF